MAAFDDRSSDHNADLTGDAKHRLTAVLHFALRHSRQCRGSPRTCEVHLTRGKPAGYKSGTDGSGDQPLPTTEIGR